MLRADIHIAKAGVALDFENGTVAHVRFIVCTRLRFSNAKSLAGLQLPFDAIIPASTRGVLITSYVTGITWQKPGKEEVAALCCSVAARAAQRFCRRGSGLGRQVAVDAGFELARTGKGTSTPVRLSFSCSADPIARAMAIRLDTRGLSSCDGDLSLGQIESERAMQRDQL